MMYLIKTNKAFNKDFILYSIVLLSLFFIALTTLNAQSKPDAPTIELVQVQATHTTVQWNPVTDATFYYIFVCNETNQCNIGILYDANHNQKTTPYLQTITPLTPNTSYSITITAYANNQWSDYSNWIHIKTKKEDTIPLTQQTNQGQQNQQNNPQTPQQPEQQQSPQQDQQQGGVQQQTPQQQNNPPACEWVTKTTIHPNSYRCSDKEHNSFYTVDQVITCGEGNCVGSCSRGLDNEFPKGHLFTHPNIPASTSCIDEGKVCSQDTGKCVSQTTCDWVDIKTSTDYPSSFRHKRTCLTKKDVLVEPQQRQQCGVGNCQGTCWDVEDNEWGQQVVVERPRGYTRTLSQREGTRIEGCGTNHECKNENCVYVAPYKINGACTISPPNRGQDCHWDHGQDRYKCTEAIQCYKSCYEIWSDGSIRNGGDAKKLTGQEHRDLCLSQLP